MCHMKRNSKFVVFLCCNLIIHFDVLFLGNCELMSSRELRKQLKGLHDDHHDHHDHHVSTTDAIFVMESAAFWHML